VEKKHEKNEQNIENEQTDQTAVSLQGGDSFGALLRAFRGRAFMWSGGSLDVCGTNSTDS
jgi:hypothetical protein